MADKRIQTVEALLVSTTSNWPNHGKLRRELRAVESAMRLHGSRRGLITVLHTTRLLDSALREFLVSKKLSPPSQPSIGRFLVALTKHTGAFGHLPVSRRLHYQRTIVNPRNVYMHGADEYPSNYVASVILGEIHACLAEVFRL